MSFEEDLWRHLQAIHDRDLDGLAATLDPDDLVLVASTGEVVFGAAAFLARHAGWFESTSWSLEMETLHVREGFDLSTCLLRLRYRDEPAEGPPVDEPSVLSLVFRRRGDRWLLVQDQNTPVR